MFIPSYALIQEQPSFKELPAKKKSVVETRLAMFEKAFLERDLSSFTNPVASTIKVIVIHSLAVAPKDHESREFNTFAEFESWLRSREHGGDEAGDELLPARAVRSRRFQRAGFVKYDNQGISHNHLYLSSIRYTKHSKGISITEVDLYDGD